jgi:hypothetical protein
MATLFNTKISNTYVGLLKTIDNAVINATLRELTDGSGNQSGLYINTAGDFKATGTLEWGTLKDTGENISITKFVDEADGIANNDNDTTIPTSAAVVDYVAARITLEDLDFSGDSGTGSVDLDSQTFAVVGTANEIETSAGSQQLQIGLPDNVTIGGNLQVNGLLKGNNNIVVKDTSDRTMAAFYGGGKSELYFNDSKKFETTSDGATVTGGLTATGGSVFTGATFSSDVDFADNAKVRFGDAQDFQIYHQGANSFIDESGTGNLYLRTSETLYIQRVSNGDNIAQFTGGAGSHLFYNNNLKISTTNTGIDVTGDVIATGDVRVPDGEFLSSGDSNDLTITNTGSEALITNYTGHLTIKNLSDDKDIIFQTDDGSGNVTTYLYLDGSQSASGNLYVKYPDNSRITLGDGSDLYFWHDGTDTKMKNGTGDLIFEQSSDDKDIIFKSDDGSGGVTTYFYLDGGGTLTRFEKRLRMQDNIQFQVGSSGDFNIFHNGTDSYLENDTGDLYIRNNVNNKDISFLSDNGSGGTAEYLKLDGSEQLINVSASNGMQFNDNVRIKVGSGTGGDLRIYHDGSNSYIEENGTGNLIISASDSIQLKSAGDEFYMIGNADGQVALYNNGIKKFETSSTGVDVTGSITTNTGSGSAILGSHLDLGDNQKARFGASQDLEIYHDASNSYIKDGGTGSLYIQGSNIFIQSSISKTAILCNDSASVDLYYDASKKFETTSTGVTVTGGITTSDDITIEGGTARKLYINSSTHNASVQSTATLDFGYGHSGSPDSIARIQLKEQANNSFDGDLIFSVPNNNGSGGSELVQALTLKNTAEAQFAGSVVIAQDLTVNGTTTTVNTSTLAVEDPLISMAKDNSANSVDIGFYGKYNDGSDRYTGLFMDASSGTEVYRLFKGLTTEPTTTVNLSGTGYSAASLIIDGLTAGNITASGELIVGSGEYISWGSSGSAAIEGSTVSNRLRFYTNSTLALTLDTSQNATFAGNINLADSKNLKLGAGQDLELFHNGTDSYIQNSTGDLEIINYADDKRIEFKCDDGSGGVETYFYCDGAGGGSQPFTVFPDNAVIAMGSNHDTYIQHTGSVGKIDNYTGDFEITNHTDDGNLSLRCDNGSGGTATYIQLDGGEVKSLFLKDSRHNDNVKAIFGTGEDLEIFHDGSHSRIKDVGSGHLTINATDFVVNNSADTKNMIIATDGGSVNLYYDASQKFRTVSGGVEVTGALSITGDGSNAATLTESSAGILTIATVDDFKVDCEGDITLDTAGNDIRFKKDGTEYGKIKSDSNNLAIHSSIENEDILFKGNDGGSTITALTLDMSDSGWAHFNTGIAVGNASATSTFAGDISIPVAKKLYFGGGSHTYISEDIDDRLRFFTGGTEFMRFTEDTSDIINFYTDATFAGNITLNSRLTFDYNGSGTGNNYLESGTNTLSFKNSGGTSVIQTNFSTGATEFSGDVTLDNILLTAATLPAQNTPSISLRSTNNEIYFQAGSANVFNFMKADYSTMLVLDGTSATFAGDVDVNGTEITVGTNNSIFAENNIRFKSSGGAFIDHNTIGQSISFRTSVSSSLDTTPLVVRSNGAINLATIKPIGHNLTNGTINNGASVTHNANTAGGNQAAGFLVVSAVPNSVTAGGAVGIFTHIHTQGANVYSELSKREENSITISESGGVFTISNSSGSTVYYQIKTINMTDFDSTINGY